MVAFGLDYFYIIYRGFAFEVDKMNSIEELKNQINYVSGVSDRINDIINIHKKLIDFLINIDKKETKTTIAEQIAEIVKIVKSDDNNWKFNSWNIPGKIKKNYREHAWNIEFAKKFIDVCFNLSKVNVFEEVVSIFLISGSIFSKVYIIFVIFYYLL